MIAHLLINIQLQNDCPSNEWIKFLKYSSHVCNFSHTFSRHTYCAKKPNVYTLHTFLYPSSTLKTILKYVRKIWLTHNFLQTLIPNIYTLSSAIKLNFCFGLLSTTDYHLYLRCTIYINENIMFTQKTPKRKCEK